jgi:hypothetical protein
MAIPGAARVAAALFATAATLFGSYCIGQKAPVEDATARPCEPADVVGTAASAHPRETLYFDHLALRTVGDTAPALSVEDGEPFQVVFVCTDPAKFTYTIAAVPTAPPAAPSGARRDSALTNDLRGRASVSMRHSRLFHYYRVDIALRDDLRTRGAEPAGVAASDAPTIEPERGGYRLWSTSFVVRVDTAAAHRK